jgi:hypothetical protein
MRAIPSVLAVAVAAVASTGFASAAEALAHHAAAPRHCVVWIAPAYGRAPSRVSRPRCYGRLSHALRVARGPAPRGFPDPKTGVEPLASTLISTDYDAANFTGTSLTWTVSNTSGCNGGFQYSAASMPSGWNDRVSSSKSAHGCATNRHFHDSNFNGSGINCTCSTMGTMSNQTSSETWSE